MKDRRHAVECDLGRTWRKVHPGDGHQRAHGPARWIYTRDRRPEDDGEGAARRSRVLVPGEVARLRLERVTSRGQICECRRRGRGEWSEGAAVQPPGEDEARLGGEVVRAREGE